MLKVVIFDSGWGGELFADLVEEELSVVDVTRVIDWRHAPYEMRSREQIKDFTEEALKPYIGRAHLIVLASEMVTLVALDYLKEKYPEQKFLGFNLCLAETIKRENLRRVVYLTTDLVRESKEYRTEKDRVGAGKEILEPSCRGWMQLIDDGEMNREILRKELGQLIVCGKDSAVVIGCSHFVDLEADLEKEFGWRVRVIDNFKDMLRGLCSELGLRGGDGSRKKYK